MNNEAARLAETFGFTLAERLLLTHSLRETVRLLAAEERSTVRPGAK